MKKVNPVAVFILSILWLFLLVFIVGISGLRGTGSMIVSFLLSGLPWILAFEKKDGHAILISLTLGSLGTSLVGGGAAFIIFN